jgi:outer membrane protein assembly factor BamB
MRGRRPGATGGPDLVDVLIVEGDEDVDVAADEMRAVLHELALEAIAWRATWPGESRPLTDTDVAADPEPAGWARRVARRYRRRALAGAVLAVAVAVTTAVVDTRQTAARAAALAARPAVLAEASTAPTEVWRVRGRVASDQDDRLLVSDGAALRSIHPATGAVLWTASAEAGGAASAGGCFPVDEGLRPDRAPVDDGPGPRGLVACVAAGTGVAASDAATDAAAGVVVVDSATGRTTLTVTVDGALLLTEPVGRDLLVTAALADGTVRVTRWDLATGSPRWDSVSPGPVLTDGVAPAVERRPESVTVGTFAVDLGTGEQLDAEQESRQPYPFEEHALPDGGRATWAWRPDRTSGRGHVTVGPTGRSSYLPGPPVRPSVTDGSDGRVLVVAVVRGDRLRGLDLRDGRVRWTRPSPGASALRATVLVDGVMLLDDGATATALDVGTGTDLWRTPVDPEVEVGALTDGEVVLLPVPGDGDRPDLVARTISDGTVLWRGETPDGTVSMRVVDHHLVASTDAHVVGLG